MQGAEIALEKASADDRIKLREPCPADGTAVHDLIARCAPLSENSLYCNLLQCTHFAKTCAVAEVDGEVVGFVSGYRLPDEPDTLFIWQVAVAPEQRGKKLGARLMKHILARPAQAKVRTLKTTIEADNRASWRMFESLAIDLSAPAGRNVLFDTRTHFGNRHDTEIQFTIGPARHPLSKSLTTEGNAT